MDRAFHFPEGGARHASPRIFGPFHHCARPPPSPAGRRHDGSVCPNIMDRAFHFPQGGARHASPGIFGPFRQSARPAPPPAGTAGARRHRAARSARWRHSPRASGGDAAVPHRDGHGQSLSGRAESRGVAARLALFYAAYFGTLGIRLPYWPMWLGEVQGLSNTQIGALMGAAQIARTAIGPLVGLASDLLRAPVTLAILLGIGCSAAHFLLLPQQGLASLVVLSCIAGAMMSATLPLGESLAVKRIPEKQYGQVRLWGSVAFIVANVAGGRVLSSSGSSAVMYMMLAGSLLLVASAALLPKERQHHKSHSSQVSSEKSAPTGTGRDTLREAVALATHPVYLVFLLSACSIQAAHATYYSFSGIMLKEAGFSGTIIGLLWGVGVAAEVLVFAQNRLQSTLGAWQLLALGGMCAVVRWAVMSTQPDLPLLLLMQVLHAGTFCVCHLGAIKFMQRAIPTELSATGYAMYSAVSDGVFMAIATYAAGHLYTAMGYKSFLAMSGLAVFGLVFAVLLGRLWDGQSLTLRSQT